MTKGPIVPGSAGNWEVVNFVYKNAWRYMNLNFLSSAIKKGLLDVISSNRTNMIVIFSLAFALNK